MTTSCQSDNYTKHTLGDNDTMSPRVCLSWLCVKKMRIHSLVCMHTLMVMMMMIDAKQLYTKGRLFMMVCVADGIKLLSPQCQGSYIKK